MVNPCIGIFWYVFGEIIWYVIKCKPSTTDLAELKNWKL